MKTDEQLVEELKQLTAGLLFMSESDYPFEVVSLKGSPELTDVYLRELAGADASAPVGNQSLDQFFRAAAAEADWKGAEELALAKRYQALVSWLKEHLDNPTVYRVGAVDIRVYILGRSPSGNWIGISTRAIET